MFDLKHALNSMPVTFWENQFCVLWNIFEWYVEFVILLLKLVPKVIELLHSYTVRLTASVESKSFKSFLYVAVLMPS